jgi:hypothetical protein
MTAQTEKAAGLKIKINKEHYTAPTEEITGSALKALASIPSGNKLFKEEPGKQPDRVIGDAEVVRLHNGDRFYDLPPGVVG